MGLSAEHREKLSKANKKPWSKDRRLAYEKLVITLTYSPYGPKIT